jgi:hypothetical protein
MALNELGLLTEWTASSFSRAMALVAPLKDRNRALERVADFAGDVSQLTDIARASIAFGDMASLYGALTLIADSVDVVSIKDRFDSPLSSGYRDILLRVRLGSGYVVELQLHLNSLMEVKNGSGHRLYEEVRALWSRAEREGRSLTLEEQSQVAELNSQARALYEAAYMTALADN